MCMFGGVCEWCTCELRSGCIYACVSVYVYACDVSEKVIEWIRGIVKEDGKCGVAFG